MPGVKTVVHDLANQKNLSWKFSIKENINYSYFLSKIDNM